MRYLVTARVKPGKEEDLLEAIENRTLGRGSIAGGEYIRDMYQARLVDDGKIKWVEVCFCSSPLLEEIPYWEEYFEHLQIKDAHGRHKCKDETGKEPWACSDCDCTAKLEQRMERWGMPFLEALQEVVVKENEGIS